jgi:hypothetical protein
LNKQRPGAAPEQRLGEYLRAEWSRRDRIAGYVGLAVLAASCGVAFGLTGGGVALVAPVLGILVIVALWTMPDTLYPPAHLVWSTLTLFLFFYLCWPDYIALVLGDLPWITAARLTGVPVTLVLAICAFGSRRYREQMIDIFRGDRVIVGLVGAFAAYAALSIAISSKPSFSAARFVIVVYTSLAPFLAALYAFNTKGRIRTFAYFLWSSPLTTSSSR